MVKHYNPSIVQDAQRILNTKMDNLSDNIGDMVAVIPILPTCRIVKNGNTSSSGGLTVYTTPTERDFYLTGIIFSMAKDSTCDVATGTVAINVVIDGTAVALAPIAVITLTAQAQIASLSLPVPIKIDRGTPISGSVTFTAGVMRRTCTLIGYTQETTAT